jgi:hypothetical protein
MGDTTNIFELPTDPTGGGNVANNINVKMTEIASNPQNLNNSQLTLDQNTINQIVSGLQQASSNGLTQLPSRDIPMTTHNITQDPNIQPNYIPQPQQKMQDYIQSAEENEEIIYNYNRQSERQNSLDEIYSELQTPLLLAILYFLFQMPFLKKQLYHYFPVLFFKDGNMNLYGLLFTSALFGMLYYLLNKLTNHYGTF